MLFLENYFSKQIWKPHFPRLQSSWKLRKLKSRDVFFNDFAEISTSRPQQRRPLRKVPNVTIDIVFFLFTFVIFRANTIDRL